MVGEGERKMVVHLEEEEVTLGEEAGYFLFRQEGVGGSFCGGLNGSCSGVSGGNLNDNGLVRITQL